MSAQNTTAEWLPRPLRRAAGCAVLLALFAAACSVARATPAPDCEEGDSLLIVAQSVPSANLIPCLEPLPDGWSVAKVVVDQDRSVITLDSDRAGARAAVLALESECDTTGAVSSPSDIENAVRYDFIATVEPSFRAFRYYVFPGGCVSWSFDFDRGASATESVEIGDTLALLSRQELNDSIRETFLDVDL